MRTKKSKMPVDETPYILCDILGEEISVGDIVVFPQGTSYSSYLNMAIVKGIKRCPKSARIYYSKGTEAWSNSYVGLSLTESGKPCNQFLRLQNPEFNLNIGKIGKLLAMKSDVESAKQDLLAGK